MERHLLIYIYVTSGKILDRREPVFSTEDGRNTCLYLAWFSGIKIRCEMVSLQWGVLLLFSPNIVFFVVQAQTSQT